jgi:hypothetical protein
MVSANAESSRIRPKAKGRKSDMPTCRRHRCLLVQTNAMSDTAAQFSSFQKGE